jgi:hypothetical protein
VKEIKKRMGLKGLELKGGYAFIKKSGSKKPKAKGNNKKIWHW